MLVLYLSMLFPFQHKSDSTITTPHISKHKQSRKCPDKYPQKIQCQCDSSPLLPIGNASKMDYSIPHPSESPTGTVLLHLIFQNTNSLEKVLTNILKRFSVNAILCLYYQSIALQKWTHDLVTESSPSPC